MKTLANTSPALNPLSFGEGEGGEVKHAAYNSLLKEIKLTEYGSGKEIFTKYPVPSIVEVDYNYKYQGQERQNELNLNWDSFKWRNYDYAIGRFMSIDPLSEKYAYQSHYNFSENRVIDGRELEGLEWEGIHTEIITQDGNSTSSIQYNAHIKVYNNSSLSGDEVRIKAIGIKNGIETAYSGYNAEGERVSTNETLEYVDSVSESDYYIEFTDNIEGASSSSVTGKVDEIGNSQSNRSQIRSDLGENTTETGQHEIGHSIGLRHENDPKNPTSVKTSMSSNNIMNSKNYGNTIITKEQLSEMGKTIPTQKNVIIDKSPENNGKAKVDNLRINQRILNL